MKETGCTIRAANPTQEEASVFARLAEMAADGYYQLLCGARCEEIIADAFLQPGNEFSHEVSVFAELGGQIVGMATAYSAEQYRDFDHDVLRKVAGRRAWRVALMEAVLSPVVRFLHKYEPGDFYLNFLAVEEDHRDKGIGSALIDALETLGRERGSNQYVLTVRAGNRGAQRLYMREGFVAEARWPRFGLVRPQVLRLVQKL